MYMSGGASIKKGGSSHDTTPVSFPRSTPSFLTLMSFTPMMAASDSKSDRNILSTGRFRLDSRREETMPTATLITATSAAPLSASFLIFFSLSVKTKQTTGSRRLMRSSSALSMMVLEEEEAAVRLLLLLEEEAMVRLLEEKEAPRLLAPLASPIKQAVNLAALQYETNVKHDVRDGLLNAPQFRTLEARRDVREGGILRGGHRFDDGGQFGIAEVVVAPEGVKAGRENGLGQLGQSGVVTKTVDEDGVGHPRATDGHLGE